MKNLIIFFVATTALCLYPHSLMTQIEVDGLIHSTTGGVKFPDATIQTTAATTFSGYGQVFTVAQTGGDFVTITSALTASAAASSSNRYLIKVMPGTYVENIVCLPFVWLQGSGKYASHIQGSVTTADSCTVDGFFIEGGVVCNGNSPTLTHNIIENSAGNGIEIIAPAEPWIKQNEVVDCAGYGIHCNGFGAEAWIIANRILRNSSGGIQCTNSSPTISNNQILENEIYGIYMTGILNFPAEPTISDNVIGRTDPGTGGIGIFMSSYVEPRIIANDIWINAIGIEIQPTTQPSILANNINYNSLTGIKCSSSGSSKPVVIKGNHIHSNPIVGLDIINCSPIVTHNNITDNDPALINPDIQYVGPVNYPMLSLNVFDILSTPAGPGAMGLYNVTSFGLLINP